MTLVTTAPDDTTTDETRAPEVAAAESDEPLLVRRVQEGDTRAFDTLVTRHSRRAYALAYRLLGHREDAEDLVQDAFIRALDRIGTVEPGRAFAPWFFRLLTNLALNRRKSRALRRTEDVPDAAYSSEPSPAERTERGEVRERFEEALLELSEKQRLIVTLFEVDGQTSAEIAAALGMSDGTVRWHIHQARRVLRAALAPFHPGTER